MKNRLFFAIFVLLAVSSFGQDVRNRYLFIEGTASRSDHQDFFRSTFAMEANGAGYVVTGTKRDSLHTLRYNVVPDNSDPDYDQYVVTISLYRNEDDAQLVTFDFVFADISELYTFGRTLFLNATSNIPLPIMTGEDELWKNKWLYLRASFDYPITFYVLQPDGLIGGTGRYDPNRGMIDPLDHIIRGMPGATVGVEYQRFNFLSLEVNFQADMGDTRDNYFINMGVGAELKGIIKFRHIMLMPYGAFTYALRPSDVFASYPPFAAGGGAELCARAGKHGVIFIDAKYMFSFPGDAVMHNLARSFYPEPAEIHYKRSQLGIGVGYKFGLFDKKRR